MKIFENIKSPGESFIQFAKSKKPKIEKKKKKIKMPRSEDMDDYTYRFYHCMICYERYDYRNHLEFALTSCGHKMCSSCIASLEKPSCPYCRKEFTAENLLQLRDD
ncbi:Oidioi.mRNA.OKI2018_I69.PAR.g8888.t1.cds [Oikopleura dioica]|uniref:Oidioi.mRNA.OKI2018_I69.PAR.g8888.t1.cds n=1 Tax=Oikopleura dioica TaxID=34765 RepID=A0ABN7RI11_OIKDI|nr:Oidioi.mRNA.OKI2018_I69.PAR.g8888.t1.cds [Oikopleura dioica]